MGILLSQHSPSFFTYFTRFNVYISKRKLTHSYEVKLELGFKRELVAKLKSSDNETFNKLGNILNKNSPIRTVKYRDEYTHNITPYRLNTHPRKMSMELLFLKLINQ